MATLTARCLCGAVRFELASPPTDAGYCHCTRCQRRTGSAVGASASVDASEVRFTAGEEHIASWRHPDGGWHKAFCRICGAHLFSREPDGGARLGIRMSAFEKDPGIRPRWRQYTAYAASWEPIPDDGLPRHPEARPR